MVTAWNSGAALTILNHADNWTGVISRAGLFSMALFGLRCEPDFADSEPGGVDGAGDVSAGARGFPCDSGNL